LPVKVVATKHDKVKPSKRDQRRRDLAEGCLLTPADVLWVSSAKNVNIDELRARIMGWLAPVEDWSPAPPTRKERAEARAAEAAAASVPAPNDEYDEYDDEDEWA
ncbi:MAG TPA: hypothetical protein VNQ33_04720, partial [Acidimicrobiales bacterium]|nr:hypothetical protein [Acidimicrobiales bacterium]